VSRAKLAGLVFGALELLGVVFAVSPVPEILEIPLTTADIAVAVVSLPIGLGAAIGLWRQRRWGWNLAIISIAIGFLDSIRVTLSDPDFGLATISAFGMVLLLFAGMLWVVDAERLRAEISPPLPESGFLSSRLYPTVAQIGLVIVAITLIGSLWGVLVLVVWLALMLWARARRSRAGTDSQAKPPYNKPLQSDWLTRWRS
jgi:hypothetical protein